MVSVSSLRRSRTILESIERSNASALSAGAAAMMSSRDSTLRGLARNSLSSAIWPGGKLLLGARAVHDQRRLEIDGRILQHDELAPALAAAGDQAADAGGELAPVDADRHDVGRAELERQHLLDEVGLARHHDEARSRLAGMTPQKVEAEARRKALADDGDIDVRRGQAAIRRPSRPRSRAPRSRAVRDSRQGRLRFRRVTQTRATTGLAPMLHATPQRQMIAGHDVYTQSTFRR